jgi:hypothetical protein
MPPKTSLDYVESKRGEDRDEESYVTATRSAKVKVIEDRLFGSVVGARNRLYSFIYIYIPKTPCPTRAPNTPSTPPHKSTPSALLYARLPAPRRAPPCPHATLSAPSRASLSARLSVSAPPCPPPPRLPDPPTPPSSDPLTLDPWPHRRCRTLNRLDAPPLNPWRLLWLEGPIL